MAWESSNRSQRLPANWRKIRTHVLYRDDYACQVISPDTGVRCLATANEVDHIIAGDDHSLTNLQAICTWHHKQKTAAEAAAARPKIAPRNRRPEQHPGAL